MKRAALLLTLAALAFSSGAGAHSYRQGAIGIGHIWALPAAAGGATAVYAPLLNTGGDADQLNSASSGMAAHAGIEDDSRSPPQTVAALALPPGRPVSLRPHGIHLALSGLTRALKPGDRLPLTLHFAQAGDARVEAIVETPPPGFSP